MENMPQEGVGLNFLLKTSLDQTLLGFQNTQDCGGVHTHIWIPEKSFFSFTIA